MEERPPLPIQELLDICVSATDGMAWGVGGDGEKEWYVYCSSRKQIKRIPSTYRGKKIKPIFCSKPRLVNDK